MPRPSRSFARARASRAQRPDDHGLWAPRLRWLTFGLTLTVAATAFEALAVATVLPLTSADLGGIAWYGWTFSGFMLANLVGVAVGGSRTDRAGPVLPFLWGTALFSGGLLVSGGAPTMPLLVLGRCTQGFGAGLLSSVSYAAIARVYDVTLQPRMLAVLSSAWVIPGLVGPGIASAISHYASWRWVFLGLAPLPPLAACLVIPALRAQRDRAPTAPPLEAPGRRTLPNALLLAAGSSLALYGLGAPWYLAAVLVPLGLSLALRGFARLMPAGTLCARPGLPASLVCMALLTAAFFGTEAFVPLALTRLRAQPVLLAGTALTTAAITWTAGAWLPVRLVPRIGQRRVVRLGLAILLAGLTLTLAVLRPSLPAWLVIPGWGVTGLGMGLAFTTTSAAILKAAPKGGEGATSASLQLVQVLGAALATGAGGALVAASFAGDPPRLGIMLVDLLMMAIAALALALSGRLAHPADGPTG